MDYFDLHCDTPYELFHKKSRFSSGNTCITAEKAGYLRKYAQVFDIWSDNKLTDDEAYAAFFEIYDNFVRELSENPEFAFCRSAGDLAEAEKNGRRAAFLGAEGANLLGGEISRLDALYSCGVRFLTLTWKGESCIGGAHKTGVGLTDFGREVILRCGELGIVVDVSHGSDRLIEEAVGLCANEKIPAIATHSNSRACCGHSRNLTDALAKKIAGAGGIIGVSFCRSHLSGEATVTADDVVRHILHYLDLGLEDGICLGGDLDGSSLPDDIGDITHLYKICECAEKSGIDGKILEKIFYGNARRFIEKYM